jgi:hypothetical protein
LRNILRTNLKFPSYIGTKLVPYFSWMIKLRLHIFYNNLQWWLINISMYKIVLGGAWFSLVIGLHIFSHSKSPFQKQKYAPITNTNLPILSLCLTFHIFMQTKKLYIPSLWNNINITNLIVISIYLSSIVLCNFLSFQFHQSSSCQVLNKTSLKPKLAKIR